MIAMMIDRPVRKHYVGRFGREYPGKLLVMLRIDDGASVVLAGKCSSCVKNTAGILSFSASDTAATVERRSAAVSLAAIEIQQNNLVPESRISRNSAATAAFRIPWVAARHDDLLRSGSCS